MKVPAMIAAELRRLTSTRMSVIALVALMLVPVLYGGLYLWANQDPYGHFDEVPVALVDLDEGVPASDGQAAAQYGADVSDQLLGGDAFAWQLHSQTSAEAALRGGDVDFIVTIPADFSAALTSAAGDDPRQATISLTTNDANNYLASTIGTQAVERIRRSVAELVGEQAASRMLSGIADIRTQLTSAVDGATQLADGAVQAADGASQLADGTARLSAGAGDLAAGARQVADGSAQVAAGTATLDGYADRAGAASQDVVDALPTARADIAQLLTDQGLDQAAIDRVLAELDTVGDAARRGNARVQAAVAQVDTLAAGAAQVSAGAAQLAAGADTLAQGAGTAADGAGQLAGGTAQLRDGSDRLRDGLASGVAAIPDTDAATRDAQAQTISDPVAVDSGSLTAAGDYGAGLAPFFAALAGWIGIYALFLIVKPISKRAVTALRSPIRVTLAGWLTPAMLGAVGMVALYGVLSIALGFRFAHPLSSLSILVLASFTYAAIILALNVWLGSVGQFLGLVMMVLQLVTAGGTFPWQTLPAPLAALHHILPMGYVVDALRQLMYGGSTARAVADIGVLMLWLGGALVLAMVGVTRMTHRRTLRDLQPSLIG
ncbi:YhgE/Pip family protein [Microbacterium sp. W1N]|uniref:YhgE/Pip family protein n=1 Tax=Microbacterium festucae TaxID=2977531 RepID=UPI0021BF336F|nr:YhgE/Pip family protein [Microbacterium festucae]MCT9819427.1 YhgE/Pip family protein [Microbacterium festucae]